MAMLDPPIAVFVNTVQILLELL